MNTINGQSAAKCLSELVNSYDESSQTSELSRRLLKLIAETGDIKLYSFEDRITTTSISGIYLLISEDKPRIYIGSSINISNRIRKHRTALRGKYHHNLHLNNIYNKGCKLYYGIIDETVELEKQEIYFIKFLNAISSINKTEDTARNFYNKKLISKNIKRTSKKVFVYNMEGVYLKSYISTAECSRQLFGDVKYNTKISRICLNKALSLKKYRFSYIYKHKLEEYTKNINTENANKKCSKQYKCLNNNKVYNSISAACRDLGIPSSSYIINDRYKEYKFIKI